MAAPSSSSAPEAAVAASCWVFTEAGKPLTQQSLIVRIGDLRPGEVLVRITAATICGSDVHTIEGRRVDPAAPLVLGHEGVGIVVATPAPSPDFVNVGARVTWGIASSCGSCDPCAAWGVPQKCIAVRKVGHAPFYSTPGAASADLSGLSGTYATHIVLPAGTAFATLPASLPDAVAAPVNCALATVFAAWRAALRALDGRSPAHVLVQGAGLLGLLACALAESRGARVVVTDVSPARRTLALRFGAAAAVEPSADTVAAATAPSGAPRIAGFDAVIEVCGVAAAVPAAVAALRPGGVAVLVGLVHPDSVLGGLTGEALIRRCATLVGVHNYAPRDLTEGVAWLAGVAERGVYPLDELTSPPFPLNDLPAAVAAARTGAYPRVLVCP